MAFLVICSNEMANGCFFIIFYHSLFISLQWIGVRSIASTHCLSDRCAVTARQEFHCLRSTLAAFLLIPISFTPSSLTPTINYSLITKICCYFTASSPFPVSAVRFASVYFCFRFVICIHLPLMSCNSIEGIAKNNENHVPKRMLIYQSFNGSGSEKKITKMLYAQDTNIFNDMRRPMKRKCCETREKQRQRYAERQNAAYTEWACTRRMLCSVQL